MSDHINELFDKDGTLIGCLLSAEAWKLAKKPVYDTLGIADKTVVPEKAEPIADWEMLTQYWDYSYPVDTDVHCDTCGSKTDDWAADTPRRFWLTSANLAGLVCFKCMNCKSKITKKHYKDEIKTECAPFIESKNTSKEGRYDR